MKCPMAPCLDRFRYIRDKFASVRWADLKEAEKRAWMLLGHSPELWKNGRNPASMQMRWEELSAEQRRQAEFLGHSQGTWQGCNDAWVAPPEYSNGTAVKLDENRIVRGRMTIQRPFTEISGNVYGQQVADLPTSFIEVFKRSVGRSLFCQNPPLSQTMMTYVDPDGQPVCKNRANYELQYNRIQVVTVVEGSIIVDFYIQCAAGQPSEDGICQGESPLDQQTPVQLFEAIQALLASMTSPLCMDMEFGRFAITSSVEEVGFSNIEHQAKRNAMEFELLRGMYNANNACELSLDFRNGKGCPRGDASHSAGVTWILMAASSFVTLYATR